MIENAHRIFSLCSLTSFPFLLTLKDCNPSSWLCLNIRQSIRIFPYQKRRISYWLVCHRITEQRSIKVYSFRHHIFNATKAFFQYVYIFWMISGTKNWQRMASLKRIPGSASLYYLVSSQEVPDKRLLNLKFNNWSHLT